MFILRSRRPQRYGKWIDKLLAPAPAEDEDAHPDPGIQLDGGLQGIECEAEDVFDMDANDEPCAP